MQVVKIYEAKTHLSRLLAPNTVKRTDFMKGQIKVLDDFNTMDSTEINDLFEGK